MLRWRVGGVLATLGALMVAGGLVGGAVAAPTPAEPVPAVLQLYYTPPVLVRAGERVLIPVDVVCATPDGRACEASVSLAARVPGGGWRRAEAAARSGLRFDVTALSSRALASNQGGRVEFFLSAAAGGRVTALGSAAAPLSFFVVRNLPSVRVAAVPFGRVRAGEALLRLAWGSGSLRAGLRPGIEAATLGPSSFDVDAVGRVYLADGMQGRLAVFSAGRLLREVPMALSAGADVAAGPDGGAFVADRAGDAVSVRTVDGSGTVARAVSVGPAASFHIHAAGGTASVNTLPLDAWVPASSGGSAAAVGMPSSDGLRIIRIGTERSVRIGLVRGDAVVSAVEITSSVRFGDVALADTDGRGGFVVVVHTWRDGPDAADQYQVIHVVGGNVAASFGVANASFANTPPLSRFRLGPDGGLYHLATTASGLTIERFALVSQKGVQR